MIAWLIKLLEDTWEELKNTPDPSFSMKNNINLVPKKKKKIKGYMRSRGKYTTGKKR